MVTFEMFIEELMKRATRDQHGKIFFTLKCDILSFTFKVYDDLDRHKEIKFLISCSEDDVSFRLASQLTYLPYQKVVEIEYSDSVVTHVRFHEIIAVMEMSITDQKVMDKLNLETKYLFNYLEKHWEEVWR